MEKIKSIFEYLELFKAEQDVAPNSLKLYMGHLKVFLRWCQENKKDVEQLQKPDILDYKNYLFFKKYSTLTIDSKITALRKFFVWCFENGIYENIVLGIRNPKRYKGHKKDPLTIDQIKSLFTSIDKSTIMGKRDFAILNLMLRNGSRPVEVSKLKIGDLEKDFDHEKKKEKYYLKITPKGSQGNKIKIMLTSKTYDPINDYLMHRDNLTQLDPLFCNIATNQKGLGITPAGLSHIIKARLRGAGINSKRITAHSLRHTAAINALKAGASLYDLQLFLGHTNPNITQLYLKAIDEEKRRDNTPAILLDEMF